MKHEILFVWAVVIGFGALSAQVARAETPSFTFDAADSITPWQFEFGGVGHTERFSPDDAKGDKKSGSLEVALKFPAAADGEHKGAYTVALAEPIDGTKYSSVEFDIKVAEGSATDSQGDNGFFSFVFRNTASNDWSEQFAEAVRTADGWRHVSADLSGAINDVHGLSFQLWGGADRNINGVVMLRIDNIKLTPKEPKSSP